MEYGLLKYLLAIFSAGFTCEQTGLNAWRAGGGGGVGPEQEQDAEQATLLH